MTKMNSLRNKIKNHIINFGLLTWKPVECDTFKKVRVLLDEYLKKTVLTNLKITTVEC